MFDQKILYKEESLKNFTNNGPADFEHAHLTDFETWKHFYYLATERSKKNHKIGHEVQVFQKVLSQLILQNNHFDNEHTNHLASSINFKQYSSCKKSKFEGDKIIKYQSQMTKVKVYLDEIFQQLNLLNIPKLSNAIEFIVNKLLSIQENIFQTIIKKSIENENLNSMIRGFKLSVKSVFCSNCLISLQKAKIESIAKKILGKTTEQQERKTLTQKKMQHNKLSQIQYLKQESQSATYFGNIEEALRNQQRSLNFTSSPMQQLLGQCMKKMRQLFDGQRQIQKVAKDMKQFDRVNNSYQDISKMKSSIDYEKFLNTIAEQLQKPVKDFLEKVYTNLNYTPKHSNRQKNTSVDQQSQTILMQQYQIRKLLQKNLTEAKSQITSIKISKNKMQDELMTCLKRLHTTEAKLSECVASGKAIANEKHLHKLINETDGFERMSKQIQNRHKSECQRIININLQQKFKLKKQIMQIRSIIQMRKQNENCYLDQGTQTNQRLNSNQNQSQNQIFLQWQVSAKQKNAQDKKKFKLNKLQYPSNKQKNRRFASMQEFTRIEDLFKGSSQQKRQLMEFQTDSQIKQKQSNQLNMLKLSKTIIQSKNSTSCKIKVCQKVHFISQMTKNLKQSQPQPQMIQARYREQRNAINLTSRKKQLIQLKPNLKHPLTPAVSKATPNMQIPEGQKSKSKSKLIRNIFREQKIRQQKPTSTQILKIKTKNKKNSIIIQPDIAINESQRQQQKNIKGSIQGELININQNNCAIKKIVEHFKKYQHQFKKLNIFQMLLEIDFKQQSLEQKFKQSKKKSQILQKVTNLITQTDVSLFLNADQAQKYEKSQGIWGKIDDYLIVDNMYMHLAERVQSHIEQMKNKNATQYHQCLLFIRRPNHFLKNVLSAQILSQKMSVLRQTLQQRQMPVNYIRDIFRKLLRIHQIFHQKCDHVSKFLEKIGFANMK